MKMFRVDSGELINLDSALVVKLAKKQDGTDYAKVVLPVDRQFDVEGTRVKDLLHALGHVH